MPLLCRLTSGIDFAGVIFIHLLDVTVGGCIRDLEIVAKAGEPEDLGQRVEYLPF